MPNADAAAPRFASRMAFTLAAIGAAVGLGNVWRFPYEAGQNGGGAFVLVYLAGVIAVAFPAFLCEMLIGRRGRGSPPTALARQATAGRQARAWKRVGQIGVLANLAVMSFYSVIGGWTLHYLAAGATGLFAGLTAEEARAHLGALQGSVPRLLGWQALFVLLTMLVVASGVRRGIEPALKLMTPAMGLLLLALVIHALLTGEAGPALAYLFAPDFAALTPEVVLAGVGQALFSVSVGLGGVMTYAAYLPERVSIPRAAASVVTADTAVALLAGLAVFPVVFAHGLDPAGGPGLIFTSLPLAFAQMPAGMLVGTLFFLFLALAALTSAVALYEPAAAYLAERGIRRRAGVPIAAGVSWLLGLLSIFSFNLWADWPLTPFAALTEGINALVLPLGVLAIALFAGWILPRTASRELFGPGGDRLYAAWRLAARWLLPGFLLLLLLANLL